MAADPRCHNLSGISQVRTFKLQKEQQVAGLELIRSMLLWNSTIPTSPAVTTVVMACAELAIPRLSSPPCGPSQRLR
jgi:hypothetical protein